MVQTDIFIRGCFTSDKHKDEETGSRRFKAVTVRGPVMMLMSYRK